MRGGLGRKMILRVPDDAKAPLPPVAIAVQAGRYRYPPGGLFEGLPSTKARFLKNGQPADPSGLTLCEPGDTIAFYSAGGGGFGNPFEREIAAVEQDVLDEYVTPDKAKQDYGVVIDSETLKADESASNALRSTMRKE